MAHAIHFKEIVRLLCNLYFLVFLRADTLTDKHKDRLTAKSIICGCKRPKKHKNENFNKKTIVFNHTLLREYKRQISYLWRYGVRNNN